MTRYIDADVMKEYIDCGHLRNPCEVCFSELDVINLIDAQPTVDAVPLDGFLKMSKGGYVIYQREWLYEHLEQEFDILRSVSGKPTIDAEPVRHGKWIEKSTGGEHFVRCSECGYIEWDAPNNYCPECGARMDEE